MCFRDVDCFSISHPKDDVAKRQILARKRPSIRLYPTARISSLSLMPHSHENYRKRSNNFWSNTRVLLYNSQMKPMPKSYDPNIVAYLKKPDNLPFVLEIGEYALKIREDMPNDVWLDIMKGLDASRHKS